MLLSLIPVLLAQEPPADPPASDAPTSDPAPEEAPPSEPPPDDTPDAEAPGPAPEPDGDATDEKADAAVKAAAEEAEAAAKEAAEAARQAAIDAEVAAKVEAELAAKVEAEVAAKLEAEVAAKVEAEVAARLAEEEARRAADERLAAEEEARQAARQAARQDGDGEARKLAVGDSPVGYGLGITLGIPTGISGAYRPEKRWMVSTALAWDFGARSFQLHGDWNWTMVEITDENAPKIRFPLTAGVGGKFSSRTSKGNWAPEIGARLPLAFHVVPNEVPIDAFLEFVPVLLVYPSTTLELDAAIGLRVYFN